MSIDPGSLADVGQWIRTGILGAILFAVLGIGNLWLRKRKEDRDGWGGLITALQFDGDISRREVASLRALHADCERRLTDVEAQLRGVHAQLVMHSSATALPLGSPSRAVAEAAVRAEEAVVKSKKRRGSP